MGGGPAEGAQAFRARVPVAAAAGEPGAVPRARGPGLVEPAGGLVDDDGMAVARLILAALDARPRPQRIAHIVALAGIIESDPDAGMLGIDDGDRNAVGHRLLAVTRPEI